MVLYALLCPHLNSSEVNLLEAMEKFLVGNTFATDEK